MRDAVLTVFAAILGGIVGSFLNACIHRLPRDLSINEPRRSFCPSCGRTIPWYENIPVLSWLFLRGKCAGCGSKISVRYLLVEVLTGALFCLAWIWYGLPLAPVFWVFIALSITATFIDFEHFIIPDVITWGGVVLGLIFSLALPTLMGTDSHWISLLRSLGGAALGYGILWGIVELGKLAFGRKKHTFDQEETFFWERHGDTATLTIGEEKLEWIDIFSREKDELIMEQVTEAEAKEPLAASTLRFRYNVLFVDDKEYNLDDLDTIRGKLRGVTIPREAMGFGDVKFIAAIGAFLGWQAVVFTVGLSAFLGCLAGLAGIFLARDRAGVRLPYGPFLAMAAIIWVFYGPPLWDWYFSVFSGLQTGLEF